MQFTLFISSITDGDCLITYVIELIDFLVVTKKISKSKKHKNELADQ